MALTKEGQQKRDWLNGIAEQAQKLLSQEPNKSQQMEWAVRRLEEADLYEDNSPPSNASPRAWAEQVIAQNPDLVDQTLPWLQERDIHPEKAQTFESLILQLIPSEGGL
jgi:hypothetical protein